MSDEKQAERDEAAEDGAEDLEVSDEAAEDVQGGLLRRNAPDQAAADRRR